MNMYYKPAFIKYVLMYIQCYVRPFNKTLMTQISDHSLLTSSSRNIYLNLKHFMSRLEHHKMLE